MFSQAVVEQIKSYVYFLQDPRTGVVFYVGKGVSNRLFDHLNCAIETDGKTEKLELIREIVGSGHSVKHYILRHGLSEETAFEVEASLIDFVGMGKLSNRQRGHYSADYGLKTAEEVAAMYEASELTTSESVLLININKLYRREMTDTELYDATRKAWVVGSRREKARFAIATYRGLTREVYEIEAWYPIKRNRKTRWGFTGAVASSEIREGMRYKSIVNIFRKGAANPIRYFNC